MRSKLLMNALSVVVSLHVVFEQKNFNIVEGGKLLREKAQRIFNGPKRCERSDKEKKAKGDANACDPFFFQLALRPRSFVSSSSPACNYPFGWPTAGWPFERRARLAWPIKEKTSTETSTASNMIRIFHFIMLMLASRCFFSGLRNSSQPPEYKNNSKIALNYMPDFSQMHEPLITSVAPLHERFSRSFFLMISGKIIWVKFST